MAIAFGSWDSAQTAAAGSITVNKPSGVVSGSLLIVRVGCATSGATWSAPADAVAWTGPVAATGRGATFYKVAGGSEPASYAFSRTGGGGTLRITISRWSGHDTTTPIQDSAGTDVTSANAVSPSVTAAVASSMLYCGLVNLGSNTTGTTQPAGMTSEYAATTTAFRAGASLGVGSGATGTKTWTSALATSYTSSVIINPPSSVDATVNAVAATATAAALPPTVSGGATVTGVAATATAQALAPSVAATQNPTVTAVPATATAQAIPPTVTAAGNVTVVPATATAQAIPPTVAGQQNPTVTAPAATATAQAIPPTVTATQNVTVAAVPATATAQALAPTVDTTQNPTVAAVPATATALAIPPTVAGQSNVTVNAVAATATAEALAPTVGLSVVVTAPPATATAQALAPTIITQPFVTATVFDHETGLPVGAGATVQLFDADGTLLDTTVTDVNGVYLFVLPVGFTDDVFTVVRVTIGAVDYQGVSEICPVQT